MIKTFISYSHSENAFEKDNLVKIIDSSKGLWDKSVNIEDIDDSLNDESIRKIIRDNFLKETTVTILMVGENAKHRKHIDWEIFSSMYDGAANSKSGIIVIDMISNRSRISNDSLKKYYNTTWTSLSDSETRNKYFDFPERIVDNLVKQGVGINVIPYLKIIENESILFEAIQLSHNNRNNQKYDLSKPMRRKNNERMTLF